MATVGLAGALVAGCSSSGAQPDDEATTTGSTPTDAVAATPSASEPSPSPSDPFALPDPVTEEYVDRVVNTIYEEWGAITREILEQPADPTAIVPVETRERIAELFGGQYLQQRLEEADNILRGDREGLLPPHEFSGLQFETRQIKRADISCLVVAGDYVTTGTAANGDSVLAAMSLEPTSDANLTGWRVIDVVRALDSDGNRVPEEQVLDASVSELEAVLGNNCQGEES